MANKNGQSFFKNEQSRQLTSVLDFDQNLLNHLSRNGWTESEEEEHEQLLMSGVWEFIPEHRLLAEAGAEDEYDSSLDLGKFNGDLDKDLPMESFVDESEDIPNPPAPLVVEDIKPSELLRPKAFFIKKEERRMVHQSAEEFEPNEGWEEITEAEFFTLLLRGWTEIDGKGKPILSSSESSKVFFRNEAGDLAVTEHHEVAEFFKRPENGWVEIPKTEFNRLEAKFAADAAAVAKAKAKTDDRSKFQKRVATILILTGLIILAVIFILPTDRTDDADYSQSSQSETVAPETPATTEQIAAANQLTNAANALESAVGTIRKITDELQKLDARLTVVETENGELKTRLDAAEAESATLRTWASAHDEWARNELYAPLVESGAIKTGAE